MKSPLESTNLVSNATCFFLFVRKKDKISFYNLIYSFLKIERLYKIDEETEKNCSSLCVNIWTSKYKYTIRNAAAICKNLSLTYSRLLFRH